MEAGRKHLSRYRLYEDLLPRSCFSPAEERYKGCLTEDWGSDPVNTSVYGLHGCSGVGFMLLFRCDLVFVIYWFPALTGNNFYLPVDNVVYLEPFGVVRLENTYNSTAKFNNFTLLTGSIFPFLSVEALLVLCE